MARLASHWCCTLGTNNCVRTFTSTAWFLPVLCHTDRSLAGSPAGRSCCFWCERSARSSAASSSDGFKQLLGRGELRNCPATMPRRPQASSGALLQATEEEVLGGLFKTAVRRSCQAAGLPQPLHASGGDLQRSDCCCFADGQVTFSYRDRSDGDRRKRETLPADQFIGRFLTHVLPDNFMRIRHYGFLVQSKSHEAS